MRASTKVSASVAGGKPGHRNRKRRMSSAILILRRLDGDVIH
jgi:hypothetical protein